MNTLRLGLCLTTQKDPIVPKKAKKPITTVAMLAGIFYSNGSFVFMLVTIRFEYINITLIAACYTKPVIIINTKVPFRYCLLNNAVQYGSSICFLD